MNKKSLKTTFLDYWSLQSASIVLEMPEFNTLMISVELVLGLVLLVFIAIH